MPKWKYDVFLSCRGEDHCKGFGGQLHNIVDQIYNDFKQNGIRVYKDDCETGNYGPPEVYEKSMVSIWFVYANDDCPHSFLRDFMGFLVTAKPKVLPILYNFEPAVVEYQTECFGEALAINGAEVHEWRKALYMLCTFDGGWVFIDTTNGYQSFINEIIGGLYEMIYEESSGCKGFKSIRRSERRLSIVWDLKTCPIPTDVIPEDIVKNTVAFVRRETKINWEVVEVYAYADFSKNSNKQDVDLHNSGVTLIHTPCVKEDITVALFELSCNCPPKSSIILITGDVGFARALGVLRQFGHNIILAISSEIGVSTPLINASNSNWCWSNVAKGPTSSSQVQIEESSQIKGLSMSCKGFESIRPSERLLSIVWDLKTCPIPTDVIPEDIVENTVAFVRHETKINWEVDEVYAYADFSKNSNKQDVDLHNSGVMLIHTPRIHTPRVKKDTTYNALLVALFKLSRNRPPPPSIILITRNIHFGKPLHAIARLGRNIILAIPSEVGVSTPLITSSSQVQIEELPGDNYKLYRFNGVKGEDRIVSTSTSQIKELSISCKVFESIPLKRRLFIAWDFENCCIPREVHAKEVVKNIKEFVKRETKIDWEVSISAYAEMSRIPIKVRAALEESGVVLIDTPHVKKDAADELLIVDLFTDSISISPPSSIMVITGDVDFARTLNELALFGHYIFLAIPFRKGVSKSLINASKYCWPWSDVANGIKELSHVDLTGLKGQLVELLERNDGQLPLGSLATEYQKIFKKQLRPLEYKSNKLVDLLKKMSDDVISVEKLNGETLVKLKG